MNYCIKSKYNSNLRNRTLQIHLYNGIGYQEHVRPPSVYHHRGTYHCHLHLKRPRICLDKVISWCYWHISTHLHSFYRLIFLSKEWEGLSNDETKYNNYQCSKIDELFDLNLLYTPKPRLSYLNIHLTKKTSFFSMINEAWKSTCFKRCLYLIFSIRIGEWH